METLDDPGEANDQQSNLALTLSLGALVGALISVLVGLFRLSRDASEQEPRSESAIPASAGDVPRPAALRPPSGTQPARSVQGAPPASGAGRSSAPEAPQASEVDSREIPAGSTSWTMPTKYIVGVLFFLLFLFIIYISRSVLSLIILAALIAFIIQPVLGFWQRRFKLRRGSAVLVTYLIVILVLILVPVLIFPSVVEAVNFVLEIDYQQLASDFALRIEAFAAQVAALPIVGYAFAPALESLSNALQGLSGIESPEPVQFDVSLASVGGRVAQTMGLLVKLLGPVVSAVVSFFFMILVSLHMSMTGSRLREWYPTILPEAYVPEITSLVDDIIKVWSSFLRGQLALMVIIGVVVWLGNAILGTPQALFLGVLAGVLEIIPSLGPVLATIPAVILALLFGSTNFDLNNVAFAIIVLIFYILVQILENQVVVPFVLGDAVDLPPVVVIIGVMIGGAAFGLLGIFLSTPIIASGREIIAYLYDKIREPPPLDEPPEKRPSILDSLVGMVQRVRLPKLPFGRRGETDAAETEGAPEAVVVEASADLGQGS